jgi:hypothetical protein
MRTHFAGDPGERDPLSYLKVREAGRTYVGNAVRRRRPPAANQEEDQEQ